MGLLATNRPVPYLRVAGLVSLGALLLSAACSRDSGEPRRPRPPRSRRRPSERPSTRLRPRRCPRLRPTRRRPGRRPLSSSASTAIAAPDRKASIGLATTSFSARSRTAPRSPASRSSSRARPASATCGRCASATRAAQSTAMRAPTGPGHLRQGHDRPRIRPGRRNPRNRAGREHPRRALAHARCAGAKDDATRARRLLNDRIRWRPPERDASQNGLSRSSRPRASSLRGGRSLDGSCDGGACAKIEQREPCADSARRASSACRSSAVRHSPRAARRAAAPTRHPSRDRRPPKRGWSTNLRRGRAGNGRRERHASSSDAPAGDAPSDAPPTDPPGIFVAVGSGGRHVRSADYGVTWMDDAALPPDAGTGDFIGLRTVVYGNGGFVGLGWRGMTSPDGNVWDDRGLLSIDSGLAPPSTRRACSSGSAAMACARRVPTGSPGPTTASTRWPLMAPSASCSATSWAVASSRATTTARAWSRPTPRRGPRALASTRS